MNDGLDRPPRSGVQTTEPPTSAAREGVGAGGPAKIVPLECLRGIAALVVVVNHLVVGFAPGVIAAIDTDANGVVLGGLSFALLQGGGGAVAFFFVLSGFVLPMPYFRRRDMDGTVRALIKRWPRLAGPCVLTLIGAWLLYAFDLYGFAEAGRIAGTDWLRNGGSPEPLPAFVPSLAGAVSQGAFWTFFRGDNFYNTSLWTMRIELIGSVVALGLAPVFAGIRGPAILFAVAGFLMMALHKLDFHLNEFVLGMVLVWLIQNGRLPRIPWPAAAVMLVAGLVLLGFPVDGPHGPYGFLRPYIPGRMALPYLWDLGAMLVIAAVLRCAALGRGLSGPAARWLGRLSFPIYLVHVPILCSLGAAVFIRASATLAPTGAILLTAAASLGATLLCAVPLALFDQWWVARLNGLAARLVRRPEAALQGRPG